MKYVLFFYELPYLRDKEVPSALLLNYFCRYYNILELNSSLEFYKCDKITVTLSGHSSELTPH